MSESTTTEAVPEIIKLTEEVANVAINHSAFDLFLGASPTVKFIMITLLVISVVSWIMIVARVQALGKVRKAVKIFEDRFWSGIDLNKLYNDLSNRRKAPTGLEILFISGYKEFARLRSQKNTSADAVMQGVHRAIRVAQTREVEQLETHLPFLATTASVTPYIGLFGTVWGIMNSFMALSGEKQATLAQVAPGIAEALIATAMGLMAAIPAVIAYNRFSHSVNRIETAYENFGEEFSGILHRKAHSAPAVEKQ